MSIMSIMSHGVDPDHCVRETQDGVEGQKESRIVVCKIQKGSGNTFVQISSFMEKKSSQRLGACFRGDAGPPSGALTANPTLSPLPRQDGKVEKRVGESETQVKDMVIESLVFFSLPKSSSCLLKKILR